MMVQSTKKKRVLIFSLAFFPHVGGAEIALKEITNRISDIEFHLLTLNFSGEMREEKFENIFVHRIGNGASYVQKILFIPRGARRAARLHRTQPFDVCWAMMSYMTLPIVLMRFCGIRVPYLLTLQEGDPWEHMFGRWFIRPFRPLLHIGFRNASAVQAISTFLAQWAYRMGYRGEVSVIPNGVAVAYFTPVKHRVFDTKVIEKKDNETWLIHTGRLVHKNALDVVVRALPLLPESVHFFMIGNGSEQGTLEKLSRTLGVSSRVHFHPYVPSESLPNYLWTCDIFIRPSRSEGMGSSFVEAMAAGLPVIATQEGGIADFLFDAARNPDKPTTGWAVDTDSPEQIATAVRAILAHPTETARVVATARTMVEEKYDWNHIAHALRALFGRLLGEQAS